LLLATPQASLIYFFGGKSPFARKTPLLTSAAVNVQTRQWRAEGGELHPKSEIAKTAFY